MLQELVLRKDIIASFDENKIIDVDFETFSEVDITKVGAHVYAEHPSTRILMMSYSINEGPTKNWNPFFHHKLPREVFRKTSRGYFVRAFNSMFEYLIWNIVGPRQFGDRWPKLDIHYYYDVMAMSCAMAFPASLEASGAALKTKSQKDKGGTRLINFFSKPHAKGKERIKDPRNHLDKFNKFIDYCDDDVNTQIDIACKTKFLSRSEHEVFVHTELMNLRGIPIDVEMVKGALDISDIFQREANNRARELIGPDCPFETLSQTGQVQKWLNANGCKIPNMQAQTITEWLTSMPASKMPGVTGEILKLRQQSAKSSISKYKAMIEGLCSDNRIRGFLKYHIARTGRWGGRGVQIQNLPRPDQRFDKHTNWDEIAQLIIDRDFDTLEWLYDDVMEVLSSSIRAAIKAPDGYKFVAADYSQIEARFVFWFADDKVGLREFGGEGKIYEGMASEIYGIPVHKVGKESFERFMGKQTILGAGFGMGPAKFVTSCKDKGGVDVELELAKRAIHGYRKRYGMVQKLWTAVEEAAIKAVNNPGSIHRYIHVSYQMRGKHLYCKLPSGRELCYPNAFVRLEKTKFGPQDKLYYWGVDAFSKKWKVLDTWGGKLTENFVQAGARDVMAHGMLNAERNGYPALFTVHDESISMVKKNFGSYKEYEKFLCETPKWARGCPIKAEGWEGPRYRK